MMKSSDSLEGKSVWTDVKALGSYKTHHKTSISFRRLDGGFGVGTSGNWKGTITLVIKAVYRMNTKTTEDSPIWTFVLVLSASQVLQ